MLNRRKTASFIAIIMAAVMVFAAPVYAQSVGDLKNDLSEAQKNVQDAKEGYAKKKDKESKVKSKIDNLKAIIRNAEAELVRIQNEIEENNGKIKKVKKRINKLEKEVGSQKSSLNKRLRAMYLAGDMSMLEVLLGSQNIVDFLANLDMVKRIHDQDVDTLNELNAKLDEVEKRKAELVDIKRKLKENQETARATKAKLYEDKKQLDKELASAHQETVAAWEAVASMQAASNRIAEELRNRESKTDYGGGKFGWPVRGKLTSGYGYRIHPISKKRKFHSGIDIAAPSGTPVHAAEAGEVIYAGWNSGGYGNLVMIDHGSNIVSCYAHNSSISVGVGKNVKRGDTIAKVGSTGYSTGPHCHFEVRVKGSPQNPMAWLS